MQAFWIFKEIIWKTKYWQTDGPMQYHNSPVRGILKRLVDTFPVLVDGIRYSLYPFYAGNMPYWKHMEHFHPWTRHLSCICPRNWEWQMDLLFPQMPILSPLSWWNNELVAGDQPAVRKYVKTISVISYIRKNWAI